MQLTTSTDLVGVQPDAFYTTGTLTTSASDGSVLELQVDNGDPDTFQVTISDDTVAMSFTAPWDDENRLRCLDRSNEESPNDFQFDCSN